jgi:hypothetical protein
MKNKIKMLKLMIVAGGLAPLVAMAEDEIGVDLTIDGIFNIITGLACWLARIAGPLMVIAVVLYGLQMMWAQGDPSKFNEAKKSFFYALLGMLVIFGVYTIIATVANAVGNNSYHSLLPLSC